MTFERKNFITADDIRAFEIACPRCWTAVSIPVKECYYKTAWQCPLCQTPFFHGGAAQNEAILSLAKAVHDLLEQSQGNTFRFRIEINIDDEEREERKAKSQTRPKA